KGRLLAATARDPSQWFAAAAVHEKLLRIDPEGAAAQDARRRLVGLYLRASDAVRQSDSFRIAPEMAMNSLRYQAAERVARELIRRGATLAGDHRLLAMALESRALPGEEKALDDSISEYGLTLELNPGDAVAAERLAGLLEDRKKEPERAERVLDGLLKARPRDAEARLVRYRFFTRLGRDDRAGAELEAAAGLTPDDVSVQLSAVSAALRRGDIPATRRLLEGLPRSIHSHPGVLAIRGQVELADGRFDRAIEEWTRGLKQSGGTNPELTWWLAYTLLGRGRLEEARPLVAQFRRLKGDDSPLLEILEAAREEQTGRVARAIARLERVEGRLDESWRRTALLTLGRCREALSDNVKALEAYRQAVRLDPREVAPRLAAARIVAARRPDEAAEEIERALLSAPGDPGLLLALADARFRQQLQRPPGRRSWADFDRALSRAAAAAPANANVARLRADRAWQTGDSDGAVKALEEAVGRAPKDATLVLALTNGLARTGKPDAALAVLDRAEGPDAVGDRAALRIQRAALLSAIGRGREARDRLGRDVERLPPDERTEVRMALGRMLAAQGDLSGARAAFERAARDQPDSPQPLLALLDLALASDDEAAVRATVESLRTRGEDDPVWRLGRVTELLGRANMPGATRAGLLEEANRLVDGVLDGAPALAVAHLLRGQVLERRDRLEEAATAYRRAWEGGSEAAVSPLVASLAKTRRFDELEELRKAVPGNALDRLCAQELLRAGAKAEAARVAEEARRAYPDESWPAALFERLGRTGDAEDVLADEVRKRPGELAPWITLIRFQSQHQRTDVDATIARAGESVKSGPPELVVARCYWAAGDIPRADKAFDAATARHPGDPEVTLAAANYFESTGRWAKAEPYLTDALQRAPDNRPIARVLAMGLSARAGDDAGQWERAWRALGAESGAAESPEDRFARGVVLTRCPDRARHEEGLSALETLVMDLPAGHRTAATASGYLVRYLLDHGQAERASRVASTAAVREPEPDRIALYIRALIEGQRLGEAERQLNRLATISPNDPREAGLRARLIWGGTLPKGDPDALERSYAERADLPGGDALGREAFALLARYGRDDTPAAERLARRLSGHTPGASWMTAHVLARQGRRRDALDLCLASARVAAPADLIQASRVAVGCTLSGEADDATLSAAMSVIEEALKHSSDDELLTLKAMMAHQVRRYDEEVGLYRKLAQRHPENFVVLNNLAWALSEGLNQPAEGIELVDKLVRQVGRKPAVLDTRGMILIRMGRHDEAIKDLEEVAAAEPSGIHLFHLACAYHKAGRSKACRDSLERARRLGLSAHQIDPGERKLLEELLAL
ncbi:MAG: tetratricopeptide repeat protein, partial [Isosphaeraceae bacterium]|nr:tetratricopeptide repeat protein [Isosphaeraceae bacterium]